GRVAWGGVRAEGALELRWSDVGRVLQVRRAYVAGEVKETKTASARSVEVIAPLAEDLAAWREHAPDDDALVCPELAGPPRNAANSRREFWDVHTNMQNWCRKALYPAAERAGVGRVIPYNGRDTYASLRLHAGDNPLLIAAALGHASTQMLFAHSAGLIAEAALTPRQDMA